MIKAVLAAVTLALGGLLYLQWRDWPPPLPAQRAPLPPGDTQAATRADPLAGLSPLEDKEEYAAIKDRPLFRPDRRPHIEGPDAAAAAPPEEATELNGMDLTGVLLSPTITTAWVKDPSRPAPVRLRPGDTLAGWTVKDIKADRLVLERQGKTDTLLLRDFNAPGASPPPPALIPAAPQRPAAPGRAAPPTGKSPSAKAPGTPAITPPGTAAAPERQIKGPGTKTKAPVGNPNSRPNVRPPTPQSPE